jgi:hypothetical protein
MYIKSSKDFRIIMNKLDELKKLSEYNFRHYNNSNILSNKFKDHCMAYNIAADLAREWFKHSDIAKYINQHMGDIFPKYVNNQGIGSYTINVYGHHYAQYVNTFEVDVELITNDEYSINEYVKHISLIIPFELMDNQTEQAIKEWAISERCRLAATIQQEIVRLQSMITYT